MSGEGYVILWRPELRWMLRDNTLTQATPYFLPQKLVWPWPYRSYYCRWPSHYSFLGGPEWKCQRLCLLEGRDPFLENWACCGKNFNNAGNVSWSFAKRKMHVYSRAWPKRRQQPRALFALVTEYAQCACMWMYNEDKCCNRSGFHNLRNPLNTPKTLSLTFPHYIFLHAIHWPMTMHVDLGEAMPLHLYKNKLVVLTHKVATRQAKDTCTMYLTYYIRQLERKLSQTILQSASCS